MQDSGTFDGLWLKFFLAPDRRDVDSAIHHQSFKRIKIQSGWAGAWLLEESSCIPNPAFDHCVTSPLREDDHHWPTAKGHGSSRETMVPTRTMIALLCNHVSDDNVPRNSDDHVGVAENEGLANGVELVVEDLSRW
jgi:hypothetical protein